MCIRDRPHAGDSSVSWIFRVHTEDELETVSSLIDRYELQHYKIEPVYDNTNPVSYTHLDVYKRQGLYNGKMGMVIFFFHYARYTGNSLYQDFAEEFLNEILELSLIHI